MGSHKQILFCGSIGLEDAEAVFRALSQTVGARAKRYPDGEPGERSNWINWQVGIFEKHPQFELGETRAMQLGGCYYDAKPFYKLRDGVDLETVEIGPLGYAEGAVDSYETFQRLSADGIIPSGVRFQVSLPTPSAVLTSHVVHAERTLIEPAYERALEAEVRTITEAIAHDDLAIQWDICTEILAYEGDSRTLFYDHPLEGSLERIERMSRWVPDRVELGAHLCYGDPGHKHILEPGDTSGAVAFANGIAARIPHRLNWIHLPVPRDRDDDAYFAPLANLQVDAATEIYLGLVHYTDGVPGTRRRIATAERHIQNFGIATECGFGRRVPTTIPDLLKLHAEIAS